MQKWAVCGCYSTTYPRNTSLFKALEAAGHVQYAHADEHGAWRNWKVFMRLWEQRRDIDVVYFVWPVHPCLWVIFLARLFIRKPIVLDFFWSPVETYLLDRGLIKKYSIKAAWYFFQDFLVTRLADVLVFDTHGREAFFQKQYSIPRRVKTKIIPVVIDMAYIGSIVPEMTTPSSAVHILFYGSYSPLQGVEYILDAANLLKDDPRFHFTLIGSGQTKSGIDAQYTKLGISNVTFIDPVPYADLIRRIKGADICLGIFGDTEKARRVIPNKVLECMACEKPVITGWNADMKSMFTDGDDIIFCELGDARGLADALKNITTDRERMARIGQHAKATVERHFSIEAISATLAQFHV